MLPWTTAYSLVHIKAFSFLVLMKPVISSILAKSNGTFSFWQQNFWAKAWRCCAETFSQLNKGNVLCLPHFPTCTRWMMLLPVSLGCCEGEFMVLVRSTEHLWLGNPIPCLLPVWHNTHLQWIGTTCCPSCHACESANIDQGMEVINADDIGALFQWQSFLNSRRVGWGRLSERSEISHAQGWILSVGVTGVLPGEAGTKPVTSQKLAWFGTGNMRLALRCHLSFRLSAILIVLQSSAADHRVAFVLSLPFAPSFPKDRAVPLWYSIFFPTAPSLSLSALPLAKEEGTEKRQLLSYPHKFFSWLQPLSLSELLIASSRLWQASAIPAEGLHHLSCASGGLGSIRFTVGLNDRRGLFQLKWFNDSAITISNKITEIHRFFNKFAVYLPPNPLHLNISY